MERKRSRQIAIVLATGLLLVACPPSDDDDDHNGVTDTGVEDQRRDGSAGTDAGDTSADLPDQPSGEEIVISYVTQTRVPDPEEYWEMWVTDQDCSWSRCDKTQVTGGSFTCEVECALAPELDYALWIDPQASTGTLMIAPIDSSYSVSTSARVVSNNVQGWEVGPQYVVYARNGVVYAQPLAGGSEVQLLTIYEEGGLPGGFHYAPHIDRVIANIPNSLSSADLIEVSVTNPTDQRLLYHFVSDIEGYPGSFYQGHMDMSVSPDGQYLAIFTMAWDMAEPCDPGNPVCANDEYECSDLNPENPRCKGEQLVLNLINRSEAHLLTTPDNPAGCSSDADCGTYHECDLDAYHETADGVCVPGHRVIGPYGRFSCMQATSGPYLDPGEYNKVTAAPMWRSDGRILFVGSNDCVDLDIPITNLVAIDPGLDSMQVVLENPGTNHGGPDCYDEVEEEYTPSGCVIQISRTAISPSGNTVVFIGSSVSSSMDTEVWLVDAFGRGGKRNLTRDILTKILQVGVFAP
ncbi:MAG: hypothetical protein JW797_07960 [Bradymonadales bacterium]|nr:hypothetical protein [Bradymonadales bacterium]